MRSLEGSILPMMTMCLFCVVSMLPCLLSTWVLSDTNCRRNFLPLSCPSWGWADGNSKCRQGIIQKNTSKQGLDEFGAAAKAIQVNNSMCWQGDKQQDDAKTIQGQVQGTCTTVIEVYCRVLRTFLAMAQGTLSYLTSGVE